MDDLSRLLLPANSTEFWTIVLAIGTWALAYTAWRGLNSLKLTKQDIEARKSRREKESAIEATRTLLHDIMPLCESLSKPYRARGFNPSDWKNVQLGENESEYHEAAVAMLSRIHQDFRIQSVQVLNSLDAWSMVITSGLAEDELTFLGCGSIYCSAVRLLLPTILYVRMARNPKTVSEVAKLYSRWSPRVDEMGLEESDEPFWARLPRTLGG